MPIEVMAVAHDGAPLGRLWRLYDRAYGSFHGLRDLGEGDRAYLRIALTRHRRRPVQLDDGVRLAPGDRVVLIHLHGAALAALGHAAGSPQAAGLTLRRVFRDGLRDLARRLEHDPALADVRAVGAITHLWHGTRPLGFTVAPLRSRAWARLIAAYQRRLMSRHAPAGRLRARRSDAGGRSEARQVWMSARTLAARYGSGASRAPTGTAV